MIFVKIRTFFIVCFYLKEALVMTFGDVLDRKEALLDYKKNVFQMGEKLDIFQRG